MESRQVVNLIHGHIDADEDLFRSSVLQIIASERRAGHTIAADALQRAFDRPPQGLRHLQRRVDMWVGRAPAFVHTAVPSKPLDDLVLRPETRAEIDNVLAEHRQREALTAAGLVPCSRVLLSGPPGNGKTRCAEGLAVALQLPFHYVSIAGLIGSYLGETGAHIAQAFQYAEAHPGMLFFDEVDALTGSRDGGTHDEMRRVVNAFLQVLDRAPRDMMLLAATNRPDAIDDAIWRRFDVQVRVDNPDRDMALAYVARRAAGGFEVEPPTATWGWVDAAVRLVSMAGLERAFDRAARAAVMAGHRRVTAHALAVAVEACSDRRAPGDGQRKG